MGSVSGALEKRLGWSFEEIRSHKNWAPGTSVLNNSEFLLTWRLARDIGPQRLGLQSVHIRQTWVSPLRQWFRRNGFALLLLLRAGSPVLESRQGVDGSHRPKQLVLLDVGYVVDNVDSLYQGEKRRVFLTILAVVRMVIWEMRNKGLYEGANFSHQDLILFFRHQLRVKIRYDRKRLDRITFNKRWVYAASLVAWKGTILESCFPPLPVQGDNGPGPSRPHPG